MNKELYLSSGGVTVKVAFEDHELADKIINNDFLSKYIPDFSISKSSSYDVAVEFLKTEVYFEYDKYPKIKMGANGLSEKDIISLIELVFERARQEKGIFCIHSSCAIYRGKAVIFWGGASGMGKTRMARLLAEDGMFYSDEKTLLNASSMEVVGGIHYTYMDKDFWKKQINKKNDDSYYPIEAIISAPAPIALFVYGFGINGTEASEDLCKPDKLTWHLYEELGRKVRAISRRVCDGNKTVPSIDSQVNADQRIKYVQKVAEKIPCYSIQGSPESVIDYIKALEIWK